MHSFRKTTHRHLWSYRSGKSTILYWIKKFQEFPGWPQPAKTLCLREPWTQDDPKFDLKKLYEYPMESASRFQFEVLKYYADLTHDLNFKLWKNYDSEGTFYDTIVCERSPRDVLKVFLPLWSSQIPDSQCRVLNAIALKLNDNLIWNQDTQYYIINIAENLMLQRVMDRQRDAEKMITPEILRKCHSLYLYFASCNPSNHHFISNNDHKDLLKIVSHILKTQ